jgi:RES domain
MWTSAAQPAARWHGDGEGPANYFADTPTGAWAEFVRHEEITDARDLAGVRRSLWAVALPDSGYAEPDLPIEMLQGGTKTYTACQAEARRLRADGSMRLQAPSAALLPGGARGWMATSTDVTPVSSDQDGVVWVLFGDHDIPGWITVDGGSPPEAVLPLVRALPA